MTRQTNTMMQIDYREFMRSQKWFARKDFPEAMAKTFHRIALQVEGVERVTAKRDFNLHSEWIPNNIRAFPRTARQTQKLANDIRRKSQFIASVSASDKLSFLSMHDEGGTRTNKNPAKYLPGGSKKNVLALPGKGLQKKKFKTSTGKTKKQYSPKTLVGLFNNKAPKKRKGRKLAFLLRAKSGHLMIVRRTTRQANPLEVLYHFLDSTHIDKDWNFSGAGEKTIRRIYAKSFYDIWRMVNNKSPLRKYRKYGEGKGTVRF